MLALTLSEDDVDSEEDANNVNIAPALILSDANIDSDDDTLAIVLALTLSDEVVNSEEDPNVVSVALQESTIGAVSEILLGNIEASKTQVFITNATANPAVFSILLLLTLSSLNIFLKFRPIIYLQLLNYLKRLVLLCHLLKNT